MKFKSVVFFMVLLSTVTGCSIKEEINEAHRIVTLEDEANRERFSEEDQAIKDELMLTSGVFQFNISQYLKLIEKDSSISMEKGRNNGFDEYRIFYANGDVIENITAKVDENYPISYSVDVIGTSEKIENTNVTPAELAFNLVSNFLMDAQITNKPLEMVINYDPKKQGEYKITENVSLIVEDGEGQEEDKGLIFKLMITRTTE
ncbi:hypothetical protein ACFQOY_08600 [Enterococcus alcedinis]|uniref:Uncharacterized protein n=1 Tax=Enterococcus alcedinis TaxID=1274384 RepID=A0A917JD82_9ENTE|nr:hypothetical protein [Enterococcus alcedinis]MBP2101558.1 hypothetical protein [Enterococcus alcedinis]GGI65048.1 hypothetical protein GCM10011482_07020 [Enterococcus alcedinis]